MKQKEREEEKKKIEVRNRRTPSILDEAEKLAAMYDYDGAIQFLKEQADYEEESPECRKR